jgi:putative SOS response-associated peptidase YedK
MCGRLQISKVAMPRLADQFQVQLPLWPFAQDTVTFVPGSLIPTIVGHTDDGSPAPHQLVPMHWGVRGQDSVIFNARFETIDTLGYFAGNWQKQRRCLIPVEAFSERGTRFWPQQHLQRDLLGIAGIYDHQQNVWVITCPAAEPVRSVHQRQPFIVYPAHYDEWLAGEEPHAYTYWSQQSQVHLERVA